MHRTIARAAVAGIVILGAMTATQAADMDTLKPRKVVRHVAVERHVDRVYDCQPGWWQTLNWGKVRPRYAARCYYRVVRR